MSRDAVVVGINGYQYLPSLTAPAQDAEAIATQLQQYGEFRVHRLPEVIQDGKPAIGTRTAIAVQDLEAALVQLFKPKGRNIPETALFYFSGHGIQKDAGIQEGFLATSDANPACGFYGLSLFWLRRLLQESPVRQRVVILDCCHSGELLNLLEADPGATSGTDRLFMAASREYESAFESLTSTYSVFTQALISGLDPTQSANGIVTNHALISSVNDQLKGELQQPLFESSGSEIILTRTNRAANRLCPTQDNQAQCPYPGIEPFQTHQAEFFWGRKALTQQLVAAVNQQNCCILTGASASGKTSVVQAGLIPTLFQERTAEGCDRWQIKTVNLSTQPFQELAQAFVDQTASELERAEQLRRIETFLEDGGRGLNQLVQASLLSRSSTATLSAPAPTAKSCSDQRFLLVIDQVEKLFTPSRGADAEQARQSLFRCLQEAITHNPQLHILLVIRADMLDRLADYSDFVQSVGQNLLRVQPMTYEDLKATVIKPAEKVGLHCEPNLVYTLLLDVVGASADLALLQQVLVELWQYRQIDPDTQQTRLTLDAYTEIGGVRDIVQRQASQVYDQLSAQEQTAVRRIFLALTQLGEGTEDSRRRILKSELVSTGFSNYQIESVLEKLIAARIVVVDKAMIGDTAYVNPQIHSANMSTALYLAQRTRGKCAAINADLKLPTTRPSGFWSCRSRWSANGNVQQPKSLNQKPLIPAGVNAMNSLSLSSSRDKSIGSSNGSSGRASDSTQLLNLKSASCPTSPKDKMWLKKNSDSLATLLSNSGAHTWSTTVDAVHEALIRNWPILRQWLEEERENVRRQRRIERAAREWQQLGCPEDATYLLQGYRLREAEDYLRLRSQELSIAAHQFIQRSQQEIHKVRKENWLMQLSIPCTLLLALGLSFSQYRLNLTAQAEQEHQRQIAASRQWAAIAQTVLEDPQSDPNTALLISRLAAEQGAPTYEAQASLRAALQEIRLRAQLNEHDTAVQQLVFSPNQQYFASASVDGNVRLWTALDPTTPNGHISSVEVLPASSEDAAHSSEQAAPLLAFSPDSQWLAIANYDSTEIQLWSTQTNKPADRLSEKLTNIQQLSFSADGQWLMGYSQSEVMLWPVATDNSAPIRLSSQVPLQSVELSSVGNKLLLATHDGQITLWNMTAGLDLLKQQDSKSLESDTAAAAKQPSTLSLTLQVLRDAAHPLAASVQHLSQPASLNNATFSPDAQWVATSGTDGNVRLWQLSTGQIQYTMPQVNQDAVSGDGLSATSSSGSKANDLVPVQQVQFSPDNRFLASVGAEQQVWIWQPKSGLLQSHLHIEPFEVEAAEMTKQPGSPAVVSAVAPQQLLQFSPDGEQLAMLHTASANQSEQSFIQLWEVESGEKIRAINPRQEAIGTFQFTVDGSHLATTAANGQIQLWDLQSRGELPTIELSEDMPQWFSFVSPSQFTGFPEFEIGQSFAPSSLPQAPQMEIVSLANHQRLQHWHVPIWLADRETPYAHTVVASNHKASKSFNLSVAPWYTEWQALLVSVINQAAKRIPLTALQSSSPGEPVALSSSLPLNFIPPTKGVENPNWQQIASLDEQWMIVAETNATETNAVQTDTAEATDTAQINVAQTNAAETADHKSAPSSVIPDVMSDPSRQTATALNLPGTQIAIATQDGLIYLYNDLDALHDVTSAKSMATTDKAVAAVQQENRLALTDTVSQPIQIQNIRRQAETDRQPSIVSKLVYSPDGKSLASINDDLTVRLWDAQSGELRQEFVGHNATILSVSFSADGQYLVTSGWDKTVRIWNINSGQMLRSRSRSDVVSQAVFSPDGQSIVATSWDGLITVFDAETGRESLSIVGHRGAIVDAAYSPDGSQFATADEDGVIKLWEAASGVEQATLSVEEDGAPIERVMFSPDGQFVAALTKSGRLYFWAATWDSLLALARDRSLYPLSTQDCYRYLRLADDECPTFELNPLAQQ